MDNKPMELCPKCKIALLVKDGGYKPVNDDTPDKSTEIYYVQHQYCNNPICEDYDKIVNTINHKLL